MWLCSSAVAVGKAEDATQGAVTEVAELAYVVAAGVGLDLCSDPQAGMTTEDLHLALRIEEKETRDKEPCQSASHASRDLPVSIHQRTVATSTGLI